MLKPQRSVAINRKTSDELHPYKVAAAKFQPERQMQRSAKLSAASQPFETDDSSLLESQNTIHQPPAASQPDMITAA